MQYLISILVFFLSFASYANSQLTAMYARDLLATQTRLASSGYLGNHRAACKPSVSAMAADRKISITVALGYMDVSANPDYYNSAQSAVRIGDVLDSYAKEAMAQALTANCQTRQAKACEFRRSGDRLSKTIRDRFTGKSVTVNVQLVSSSVSGSDQANKSTYLKKQNQQSANARAKFLGAVQSQDVVLYLGHARSGGGPDFLPPQLNSATSVDYSYYKSQQPGIRALLGALQGGRPQLLAILACNSTPLFGGSLRARMGGGTLVTANQLFDYNDMLPTGLAVIEATLGQSCGSDFEAITGMAAGRGMLSVR